MVTSYPSLRDRVVVVTGGASGIGLASVELLAAKQNQVVILAPLRGFS